MKRYSWVIPLLLAGCVPLATKGIGREIDLMVYPKITPKTQAILNPNTLSSIATLDIIPYIYDAGAYKPISSITGLPTTPGAVDMLKLTEASPSIDPNRPFLIRRLKPSKDYRVRAQAYNQANALISEDNTSYVDVSVGNNDAPAMASLPVNLINTPFGASTSVLVNTDGRYEYLKGTLYLVAGGAQVALLQTTRNNPEFAFSNLQAATNYRLLIEAYKLGAVMASTSLTINPGNETLPTTQSVSLTIPYVVKSFVGSNATGFQDGTGTAALFNTVTGVELDSQGNLYAVDISNHAIRKITPNGVVTTLAGNGSAGSVNGTGSAAQFNYIHSIEVDLAGNVYVADHNNNLIRKITPTGVTTTFVGGVAGFADGTGTAALIRPPVDIAIDSQGNLFFTDGGNHCIRKITASGVVTTYAGNGTAGHTDGPIASATFSNPRGVVFDGQGNLYVSEYTNNYDIRKITPAGVVSTLAGNGTAGNANGTGSAAQFNWPEMMTVDPQGNVYVADHLDHRIRRITPNGVVTTIAGNGSAGCTDGTGTNAILNQPWGLTMDAQGVLYLGEFSNNPIRKIY